MINYDNNDWNDPDKFLIGKFPPRLEFLNIEFYKVNIRTVASILILLTALIFLVPLM